ncbi:MAG: hypothetical protein MUO21_04920 [Nitrososphaeraceae archaeon]|nr:hypothetical protein [Nitrososphaeraceae archaeon]
MSTSQRNPKRKLTPREIAIAKLRAPPKGRPTTRGSAGQLGRQSKVSSPQRRSIPNIGEAFPTKLNSKPIFPRASITAGLKARATAVKVTKMAPVAADLFASEIIDFLADETRRTLGDKKHLTIDLFKSNERIACYTKILAKVGKSLHSTVGGKERQIGIAKSAILRHFKKSLNIKVRIDDTVKSKIVAIVNGGLAELGVMANEVARASGRVILKDRDVNVAGGAYFHWMQFNN